MKQISAYAAVISAVFLTACLQANAQSEDAALSFPRTHDADGATIVVHVPQIDTWADFAGWKVDSRLR